MKIVRMNKGSWGKVIAFFDIMTDEGFVAKGFKLINGDKGVFVGMPSTQSKDNNWYDIIYPSSSVLGDELRHLAKEYYGGENLPAEPERAEPPPLGDDDIPF